MGELGRTLLLIARDFTAPMEGCRRNPSPLRLVPLDSFSFRIFSTQLFGSGVWGRVGINQNLTQPLVMHM